jgi:hypothetical protein
MLAQISLELFSLNEKDLNGIPLRSFFDRIIPSRLKQVLG